MARKVKLSGLDKLNRRLYQLPIQAKKEISIAMETGAQEVVNFAKNLVPVGVDTNRPGALRDSIGWTWGDPPGGSITLGTVRSGRGKYDMYITIYAGNNEAFYARWVEFGTIAHTIRIRKKKVMARGGKIYGTKVNHPGGKAKPFFFHSYRALKTRIKRRVSRAIVSSIKHVVSK